MLDVNKLAKVEGLTNKRKVVRRTYKTKLGTKTKEYVYAQSELLFRKTKTGYKVQPEAWKKFEAAIRREYGNNSTAESIISNARRIKDDILYGSKSGLVKYGGQKQYSSATQPGWNRIDVHSFISRLASETAEKFLINMGLTPNDVIQYVYDQTGYTIDQMELINPGNWINDEWDGNSVEGKHIHLKIEFNYNGVDHIQITL